MAGVFQVDGRQQPVVGEVAEAVPLLQLEALVVKFAPVLPVDVAYTTVAMEKGIQPGFHNNPHDGVLSIRRVKELAAEHGAQVFLSHDMDAWHTYRHAPDAYEI